MKRSDSHGTFHRSFGSIDRSGSAVAVMSTILSIMSRSPFWNFSYEPVVLIFMLDGNEWKLVVKVKSPCDSCELRGFDMTTGVHYIQPGEVGEIIFITTANNYGLSEEKIDNMSRL